MKQILTIALVFLASGCASLLPIDRHQSQSVKTTEAINTENEKTIRRTLTVAPSIWTRAAKGAVQQGQQVAQRPDYVATDSGPYINEVVEVESRTSTGAGSRDIAKGDETVSIPLFVKIIGIVVGLGIATVLIWIWRRSSVAANAAFSAGDQMAASMISQLETWAANASDPSEQAKVATLLNLANKERGKLTSRRAK